MSLASRFESRLTALGLSSPGTHLLVAVSGGCDSVTLLHLLRFASSAGPRLTAAHLDHAMRPGSDADAAWVRGLCAAWEIPLISGRAQVPLRTETEARHERYRFLRRAARQAGATHIATAHHADDQAETVLFRVLRGTGLEGLGGIRDASDDGLVRPLLPFWRGDVERYARSVGLRWRIDPTNRSRGPARNRLRSELIPRIEETVAPAARRNLVGLAELAQEAEAGLDAVVEQLEREAVQWSGGEAVLARHLFRDYHPALGSRLLRNVLRRFGPAPSRAGTRLALQFITDSPSGRGFSLPGGATITLEFDRVRVGVPQGPSPPDRPLEIDDASSPGTGEIRVGGRKCKVSWSVEPLRYRPSAAEWSAAFDPEAVSFPLQLRGWMPGDRIRLQPGSRRLKKLFGDRRVPLSERTRTPVLVDKDGTVLWVAGVAQDPATRSEVGKTALLLEIVHG